MLFNSLHFALFFPLVTLIYFLLPPKYRWIWLLFSSCYFYMSFVPVYMLILGFTIIIDYFAGILLETSEGKKKKNYLIISLLANIGVLVIFKYYNFLTENISVLLNNLDYHNSIPNLSILLPIGLSFHTFQAMSYTIEVYRGNQKAERHFGIYALYVMFYPQLVAGPIERPQNLLPQFHTTHAFDYERITDGLKLMMWGLFKKVVIADRLAIMVDNVYNQPQTHTGATFLLATFFFSFQIFCDFSGYSDIAIGAAQVMGFKLMTNFDRPYHAQSIREFWSKWHISLSTWFKDYLYISIGGNRVSIPRWYLNLLIVFIVSGLWHGANWTFVIWGALHGFYLVFGLITQKWRNKVAIHLKLATFPLLNKSLQIASTFALTAFAWIFFRANSLSDALYIIKHSFTGLFNQEATILYQGMELNQRLGISKSSLLIAIVALLVMESVHLLQYKYHLRDMIRTQPAYIRWLIYYAAMLSILFLGVYEDRQFIYFQF